MSIEALIDVAPPPPKLTRPFEGSWEAIEAEIGTQLPQDYKDLVRVYGDGEFISLIRIMTPSIPPRYGHLIPEVYLWQQYFVEVDPMTMPMYPQPGGLLTCGSSSIGDHIFWLTRGPVAEWPIVIWNRSDPDSGLELFECNLTDFVAGCIKGEIHPRAFGDNLVGAEELPGFLAWPEPKDI